MTKVHFTFITFILVFIAMFGCASNGTDSSNGDDSNSSGDGDSDTDTDADTDVEGDTGTETDNGTADHAYVPDASMLVSPPRGIYDEEQAVTISSNIDDSEIYYTLDGSKPSADNGTRFESEITVSSTATIRAVVVTNGVPMTPVQTHTYVFPADVIRQGDERPDGPYVFWTTEMDPIVVDDSSYNGMIEDALKSIPTMSVVTDYEKIFGESGIHRGNNLMDGDGSKDGDPPHPDWEEEVEVSLEMFYPDAYPRVNGGGFQVDAGLKAQGGGGRWDMGTYDHKQSFGLRFRSEYGYPSLKYPIFEDAPLNGETEAGKYDKLILRAGHNKSWGATWDNEHSVYTRDQLGRDIQIQMSGIGARGTFVHLYLNGLYWGLYNVTERPDDAHSANYLDGEESDYYCGKAKGGDVDGDNTRFNHWLDEVVHDNDFDVLQEYLAVDEYIDMALSNVYAVTGDFPQYYYGNRNTGIPGPIYFYNWDIEDAFGGGSRRSSDDPDAGVFEECHGFEEMWENYPEFRERLAQRVEQATTDGGALTDENVSADWNALNNYIEDAIVCESARWGDERIDDTGERYTRDDHWIPARDAVTDAISGRADRLIDELQSNSLAGHSFLSD